MRLMGICLMIAALFVGAAFFLNWLWSQSTGAYVIVGLIVVIGVGGLLKWMLWAPEKPDPVSSASPAPHKVN
jgi:uncharacterized membrane protein